MLHNSVIFVYDTIMCWDGREWSSDLRDTCSIWQHELLLVVPVLMNSYLSYSVFWATLLRRHSMPWSGIIIWKVKLISQVIDSRVIFVLKIQSIFFARACILGNVTKNRISKSRKYKTMTSYVMSYMVSYITQYHSNTRKASIWCHIWCPWTYAWYP
jgi:hypothetical protein